MSYSGYRLPAIIVNTISNVCNCQLTGFGRLLPVPWPPEPPHPALTRPRLESTLRYLGIKVDDALEMTEQNDA